MEKNAVVEQGGDGGGDHDFLAHHAESAGGDAEREPESPRETLVGRRFESAHGAVNRRKVEKRDHELGALHDVNDGLAEQRVDRPDERDADGEQLRVWTEAGGYRVAREGADEEEHQDLLPVSSLLSLP